MSTYKGFAVLEPRPDAAGVQRGLTPGASILDSKTGARRVDDRYGFPVQSQQVSFFADNRTDADALRAFFSALRGRAVPFWAPSWRSDLALYEAVSAGVSTIKIQPCGYTTYAWPSAHLHDLQITLADGTVQRRRISGATDNTTYESLLLDSALSYSLTTTNCMVSYLTLYRLGSDTITTAWETNTQATVSVELVELPWEVPA